MSVTLLAVPGSHACAAVAAMLNAKRVAYQRVDLFPALSRGWLRLAGFHGGTVPALRIDGRRVQGSRAIARSLDAEWPEPRLFPTDPDARERVEEIEAWADGPLQEVARRIILWSLLHNGEAVRAALDGARLQFRVPTQLAAVAAWPVIRLDAALHGAHAHAVRGDLAALPRMLDRADGWIARGDVGSRPPTAADYQVAASARLLLTVEDLTGLLDERPVTTLARRLIPVLPGPVPTGALPAAWLAVTNARAAGQDVLPQAPEAASAKRPRRSSECP
jgi:glutathione S-transferase